MYQVKVTVIMTMKWLIQVGALDGQVFGHVMHVSREDINRSHLRECVISKRIEDRSFDALQANSVAVGYDQHVQRIEFIR